MKKKLGRPNSTSEKKIVVSGYIKKSQFKKIAMEAIKHKQSLSKEIENLIEKGLAISNMKGE